MIVKTRISDSLKLETPILWLTVLDQNMITT